MNTMTREQAIQHQIDEIMDSFDFGEVIKIMDATGWRWARSESESETPTEPEVRRFARDTMKLAAGGGFASSGGFSAMLKEGDYESGHWLRMDLYFGLQSFSGETGYER